MGEAAFEAQRERIMALVHRWKPIIANEWLIHIFWDREPPEESPYGGNPAARADYRWDYMEGSIKFFLTECEGLDDGAIEQLVIHELSHFLVAEAIESTSLTVLRSHKEHLTTQVQRAISAAAGMNSLQYEMKEELRGDA